MKTKRLTMDTDYSDLCYHNRGAETHIEQLFDKLGENGFDATIWDTFWCGTALYHSTLLPLFENRLGFESAKNVAANLKQFDPLALAVGHGKKRNIMVLPYFRLLEEAYAPFDGHAFFTKNPEYWLQSRNGMHRIVGWPCYNYPEVREHMMKRLDDLVKHGVTGVFFDSARSHIPYFYPWHWGNGDMFGFNQPVVDEFKRRHGIDLSKYDHAEEVVISKNIDGTPFNSYHKFVGTESYDGLALRKLLGEGIEQFFREVRAKYPDLYIAYQSRLYDGGGTDEEIRGEYFQHSLFRINLEALCADGIINEFSVSQDYAVGEFDTSMLPRFEHVKKSQVQLTAWLNNIFTPTGGEATVEITEDQLKRYVDSFLNSKLDGAIVHESAFLLEREDAGKAWSIVSRFK